MTMNVKTGAAAVSAPLVAQINKYAPKCFRVSDQSKKGFRFLVIFTLVIQAVGILTAGNSAGIMAILLIGLDVYIAAALVKSRNQDIEEATGFPLAFVLYCYRNQQDSGLPMTLEGVQSHLDIRYRDIDDIGKTAPVIECWLPCTITNTALSATDLSYKTRAVVSCLRDRFLREYPMWSGKAFSRRFRALEVVDLQVTETCVLISLVYSNTPEAVKTLEAYQAAYYNAAQPVQPPTLEIDEELD